MSRDEDLDAQARRAYADGRFEAAIASWEELFTRHLDAGRRGDAAVVGGTIALHLLIDTGMMAPVRGWHRRSERLLVAGEPQVADALLATVGTYERFLSGDAAAARQQARSAISLGEQLEFRPAVIMGRTATARLDIEDGRVDDALVAMDEIAVELTTGAVDPLTTGIAYCEIICAAQGLARYDRAREWTDMMDRWRADHAFGGLSGRCRVHRAELLRLSGPGDAAEAEALHACEELRPWLRREYGWPLVELGDIRFRRGDLSGAEEAFLTAHQRGWSPQPGLALLRLAQGDADAAAQLIDRAVAAPDPIPSKEQPPFSELRLAPLLAAQAEIAAARGDHRTLEQAAQALTGIARHFPGPALRARAQLARAQADLDDAAPARAVACAAEAVSIWADLRAPFESASARIVLGQAHQASGNAESAALEWDSARGELTAFGADFWARRVPGGADGESLGRSEIRATLRGHGKGRVIVFDGHEVLLPDLVGLRYLARLLAAPGRAFHVSELIGSPVQESAIEVLDDQAIAAYRRRLAEVEEDIEQARARGDADQEARAERDRDFLVAELSGAVGLGGRRRTTGGTTERGRTAVTRSIRYAIARVAEQNADLGDHLDRAIRTGVTCSYTPDPLVTVIWEVS